MPNSSSKIIVLCDFDGTISELDVGNELHRSLFPDGFRELQQQYRSGKLNLRELQNLMWTDFPLGQSDFRKQSKAFARLRAGFLDFLSECGRLKIPFYIASCGIRDYIEAVLEETLSPSQLLLIQGIYCNEAEFSPGKLDRLVTSEDSHSTLTLDKGRLANELRLLHPQTRILGIGNGTSDRSMAGHVEVLAATDALARWAKSQEMPYVEFNDFSTLSIPKLFAE